MGDWCLIESDPGVFTELIHSVGCDEASMEEVYYLDQLLSDWKHAETFGLVFLFKIDKEGYKSRKDFAQANYSSPKGLFFAQQIIQNACATQAILNIIMNLGDGLSIGKTLSEFKQFTSDFTPEMKGLSISNSDPIKLAHNSFARNSPFIIENSNSKDNDEDMFHFISYIPFQGHVYELDGLHEAPIKHGAIGENWLVEAARVVQERINSFSSSEIRFNLMACVRNPIKLLEIEIGECDKLMKAGEDSLKAMVSERKSELEYQLKQEEEKLKKYKCENAVRKHNFIPFIFKLLGLMVQNNLLEGKF